jgi:ribonuclease J
MSVKLYALGGFGEVGRNCLAIEIDKKIILCDLGMHLEKYLEQEESELFKEKHLLRKMMQAGAFPDISLINPKQVVGIVCTHAHIDHVGAIPYMIQKFSCPVYATPFTAAVIESLCQGKQPVHVRTCLPGKSVRIQGIVIDFIPVCHSTPQSVNLAVHTPQGVIIYGNDYKEDSFAHESTDMGAYASYKGKTKLLVLDSLYAPQDICQPSESQAQLAVEELQPRLKGHRLIVASTFSSHIFRLEALAKLGKKLGRKVMFVGRSLDRYIRAAKKAKIADLSSYGEVIAFSGHAKKFFAKMPDPSKYFVITTGHQGEPNAMLTRLLDGLFSFTPEDVIVFSSRVIPASVTLRNSEVLQKKIDAKGIPYIRDVHVSGHAANKDHVRLLDLVCPEHVIPSHCDQETVDAFKNNHPDQNIKVIYSGDVFTL